MNKVLVDDEELLELAEMETAIFLIRFQVMTLPVISRFSSLKPDGDSKYEDIIMELMDTVDERHPNQNDTDKTITSSSRRRLSITRTWYSCFRDRPTGSCQRRNRNRW